MEDGSEEEVGVVCLSEERGYRHEQAGDRQIGILLVDHTQLTR